MKKRTFLLLEILIALFLVSLCILPLVQYPLRMLKIEREKLEEMEKERMADWTFSEVKELLLKNEIPWEKIPKKGETSPPFPLPDLLLQLPGCKPKKIARSFFLKGQAMKLGKSGEDIRQIYIHINLGGGKNYCFRLPVQKLEPLSK